MSEEKDKKSIDGPWGKIKNSSSTPLRLPNSVADINVSSSKVKNDVNQASETVQSKSTLLINDGIVRNSKLNVNAAEFVPSSLKNRVVNDDLEYILSELKYELHYLSMYPEKYEEVWGRLNYLLNPHMSDENIWKAVIDIILNECIKVANLRYSGVRLCSDFNATLGKFFRTILLTRCQEEHAKFITNSSQNDASYLVRLCGFGLTLAELLLQIQIDGKCIDCLGQGLLSILELIIKSERETSIKCMCQVLKFTGCKLKEISESSLQKMDELFSHLERIAAYPDVDPNLRFTINSVIEMRNSDWGRNKNEQPSSSEAPPVDSDGLISDDPVFFGPDGKVITAEETAFLHDNIPLSEDLDDYVCDQDSMDEEVSNDFEEFLKFTAAKNRSK